MGRRLVLFVAIVCLVPLLASCAGPAGQRATQGGFIGAGLGAAAGYIVGGGRGAAVGALAGAAVGALAGGGIGAAEARNIYSEPQPLPWLVGDGGTPPKSIRIMSRSGSWGYGMDVALPVLEDQFKRRGAIVVRNPGPQYYPSSPGQPESIATDFVAEFHVVNQGGAVRVDITVLDRATQVRAIGSHRVYYHYGHGGGDQAEALRLAARNAVWDLK